MSVMDLVQFDQITVIGPTSTLQIGVHAHSVGLGAPSNSDCANGTWTFAMGLRNPAPAADYNQYGDSLSVSGRVLQDSPQMWSANLGAVHPTVDETVSSSMVVTAGQAFEPGAELTIAVLKLDVSFSQVRWRAWRRWASWPCAGVAPRARPELPAGRAQARCSARAASATSAGPA